MLGSDQMKTSMFNTWEDAQIAREHLIETASDYDSELADIVIEAESFDKVSEEQLRNALRRISLSPSSKTLVTLIGSSYTNIGVQPLMDAIVHYSPSPDDIVKEKCCR